MDIKELKEKFKIYSSDKGNIITDAGNYWVPWVKSLPPKDREKLEKIKEEDYHGYYDVILIFLIYASSKAKTTEELLKIRKKIKLSTILDLWYNICKSKGGE